MAVAGSTAASEQGNQDMALGCESVQDLLNVAVTGEALAVTFLGVTLDATAAETLAFDPEAIGRLVAARSAEQAHYDVLVASGAVPQPTTFTLATGGYRENEVSPPPLATPAG